MEMPAVKHDSSSEYPPPQSLTAGAYVTDESNLFRCISVEEHHPYATVLLEDCLTLEVIILPLDELGTKHLRMVRQGNGEDSS